MMPPHEEMSRGVALVDIKSSLTLQMVMLYQGMFSILYFAVCGGCLSQKMLNYDFQNGILTILTLPIFLLWSGTEIVRVVLGYVGNVNERVPMISAFLLLTIFPQFVALLFLTFLQDPVFPCDRTAGFIMLCFLFVELCVGWYSLSILIWHQTAHFFRLCQEEEMRELNRAPSLIRAPSALD